MATAPHVAAIMDILLTVMEIVVDQRMTPDPLVAEGSVAGTASVRIPWTTSRLLIRNLHVPMTGTS